MSRDLYSAHSTMLRATVLLCLVASAVVTHSLAAIDPLQDIDPTNDNTTMDYSTVDIDYTISDDGYIDNNAGYCTKYAADFRRMIIDNCK